jgi:hypothetical protein
MANGTASCWGCGQVKDDDGGYTDFGQCSVPPELTFTQISASTIQTCGLMENGEAKCWGCGYPSCIVCPCSVPPIIF